MSSVSAAARSRGTAAPCPVSSCAARRAALSLLGRSDTSSFCAARRRLDRTSRRERLRHPPYDAPRPLDRTSSSAASRGSAARLKRASRAAAAAPSSLAARAASPPSSSSWARPPRPPPPRGCSSRCASYAVVRARGSDSSWLRGDILARRAIARTHLEHRAGAALRRRRLAPPPPPPPPPRGTVTRHRREARS